MGTYTGNYPFTEGREELSRDPSIALRWVVERRSGIHEWIALPLDVCW